MKLKSIVSLFILFLTTAYGYAQGNKAMSILDKTAGIVGRRGGASADFTFSNTKVGSVSGSIAIKGNKFNAHTPHAIVWFNGKTQWTYLRKTEEVNITTPTQAQQMSMNPYTFIHIYKTGYTMSVDEVGNNYNVHLTAKNTSRTIKEMYITIDKKTYVPSKIKMRQNSQWSTIMISNFKEKNQANSLFVFNAKDFPKAEVVDLR